MLEAALPEFAIALEPPGRFRERFGLEPARPPLGVAALRDQARTLQHLEVLRDCGLADHERLGQLRHRCPARGEPGEDRTPCRIWQRRAPGVEPGSRDPSLTLT